MKFREQENRSEGQVELNLTDILHNKERVEFGPQNEAVSITRYREMVEAMVLELTENTLILQKTKRVKTYQPVKQENSLNYCIQHIHILLRIC